MQSVIVANFQNNGQRQLPCKFSRPKKRGQGETTYAVIRKYESTLEAVFVAIYIYIYIIMYIIWFLTGVIAYPKTFRKAFYFSL